jgi:hypothetical protein
VSRPRADGRRCYVCASGLGFDGCGKIRSLAEPLEELVVAAVIDALDGPALAKAIQRERRKSEKADDSVRVLSAEEGRLADLARDFAERRISRLEWLAARDVIDHQLDVLRNEVNAEQQVASVQEHAGRGASLRRLWAKLTLDQQRAIVAAVLVNCVVNPAIRGRNTFDGSRVQFSWRF